MDKATTQHTCEPPLFRTKRPKVDKMFFTCVHGNHHLH